MGGHAPATPIQAPDYTGIQLQTAAMSLPVPLAWGLARGSPNLMDYVNFQVHKKTVGKGGGTGKTTEYTYSASIVMGICEGPITGVNKSYINNGFVAGFYGPHFSLFLGTTPQTPWSYMTSNYPTHALSYQGIAYVAGANFDLGTSESLPAFSFEVKAPLYNTQVGGAGDADPALMVEDFLTNGQYGANFPTARIDFASLLSSGLAPTTGDSAFQTYCQAMGFGLSPFIQNQEAGISILARWMQLTNTAPVWTGYSLKFVPYGDEIVTGNGVTYLPPTAQQFDLGDDDYVQEKDADPVQMNVRDWFDAYNAIAIECSVRSYDYNAVPIDWIDQGSVDLIGRRQASQISAREVCDTAMATKMVALIGARMVYIRKTYKFKLGPEHTGLEPMDVGIITDTKAGILAQPVRIQSVEENDDGTMTFICEEFPGTVGMPSSGTLSGPTSTPINSQVVPDPVNTPLIFETNSEASAFLNNGSPAALVVALVSGGSGGVFDPYWGGAAVNVSTDGTTYVPLADVNGSTEVLQPASMGELTANLATYVGANPDTGHTLAVSLAESNGTLVSASSGTTAAAGATLGVIQDSGGSVELIGPQTATLTGANAYNLTNLYRGLLSTTAAAHVTGALYGRLDASAFLAVLPPAYIGKLLYFKFQSFNIWGQALQDISTCTPYTYTPTGIGFGGGSGGVPTAPTGFSATGGDTQVALAWSANPLTDNVTAYEVWRAAGTGQPFSSASLIATTGALAYTDSGLPISTGYTYFLVALNAVGSSGHTSGEDATTTATGFGGPITGSATASEAIAAGAVCYVYSSSGATVENANATDLTKPANAFVLAAYLTSATATVHFAGELITGLSGLTPGATYWLDVTPGGITTTPPSTAGNGAQIVGVALTASELFFDPQPITGVIP